MKYGNERIGEYSRRIFMWEKVGVFWIGPFERCNLYHGGHREKEKVEYDIGREEGGIGFLCKKMVESNPEYYKGIYEKGNPKVPASIKKIEEQKRKESVQKQQENHLTLCSRALSQKFYLY